MFAVTGDVSHGQHGSGDAGLILMCTQSNHNIIYTAGPTKLFCLALYPSIACGTKDVVVNKFNYIYIYVLVLHLSVKNNYIMHMTIIDFDSKKL